MPTKQKPSQRIHKVARERLGLEELWPGQEEAVRAILSGHDVLVVRPTGSGKSAIYQIAGLIIDGPTVVISPLIALQKDQTDAISEATDAEAVALNSTLKADETREVLEKIVEGEAEYIFLAPEQLAKSETVDNLREAGVSLFVVDEAHCISQWGHDFRPDYLKIGPVIEALDRPRVLALTATASADVRDEIVQRLRMQNPKVFVHGFDRPNLYLRVDSFETENDKREALVHRAHWAAKPGIIYVATRKDAEQIRDELAEQGTEALFYHGGMKADERERIQDQFMTGDAEVMVATNAFGMGVDKSDVRFVYHYDISDSLDAYYQEVGRAGRDGEKAEAVLFYRHQNVNAQKYKTAEGKLAPEMVLKVAEIVAEEDGPLDAEQIADGMNLSRRKLTTALTRLEDAGAIETLPDGQVQAADNIDVHEAAQAVADGQEQRAEMKRQRLEEMRSYAETSNCRRETLLRYFGDDYTGPCNNCDNCEAAAAGGIRVDKSAGTRREVT